MKFNILIKHFLTEADKVNPADFHRLVPQRQRRPTITYVFRDRLNHFIFLTGRIINISAYSSAQAVHFFRQRYPQFRREFIEAVEYSEYERYKERRRLQRQHDEERFLPPPSPSPQIFKQGELNFDV
jgi:hypothetical protein